MDRVWLDNIVLILLGLGLFGLLAAILQTLGLKNHPYVSPVHDRLIACHTHAQTAEPLPLNASA
jgi:hypothetical protein